MSARPAALPPGEAAPGRESIPARRPPLLYFGFAHACLAAAGVALALDPRGIAGFYYHPRLVAVVHLVTLGWITSSILGSLYLIGPLALRLPLPTRRLDLWAFGAFAVGVLGMISHFWIDQLPGMAWAGGMTALAILAVAVRVLHGLRGARIPREVKLHVGLALTNLLGAALLGVLLGIHKNAPLLPFAQLAGVLGHAHLAGLGFAVMMVMGAGYRMLPMILPSAMPRGAWLYVSALLTQLAAVGLLGAFTLAPRLVPLFAMCAALGVAAFLTRVAWMLRHRRPASGERRLPDWGVAHAFAALVWLAATLTLGLALAFATPSETTLRAAMAYGVFGLLGFLAQMVVGVQLRLLPLCGWLWGFADRGFTQSPPSLHRVPERGLEALSFLLWLSAVPALAAGLAGDRLALVAGGGVGLFLAALAGAANCTLVLVRLVRG